MYLYTFSRAFLHVFYILCIVNVCISKDSELTIDLPPGQKECFYEKVGQGSNIEIEYQVISGGDMDIDFLLQAPGGGLLVTEYRRQDNRHKFRAEEDGDYVMCFDNTFSRFSNKLVFFEFITDEPEPEEDWEKMAANAEAEVIDMQIEDFRSAMEKVKANLVRSISQQNLLKAHETRDRNIMENNFERVNIWSGIQLFVMLSVGLVQVLMIRSLFDDNSKLSKLFKSRT